MIIGITDFHIPGLKKNQMVSFIKMVHISLTSLHEEVPD